MKKTIYTLNVNDYCPEITALTYPLIERWAHKIGAEFYVIKSRKYNPRYTPVYEKFQVYQLSEARHDEWSIFIDSDAIVHPDMFDPTEFMTKDQVAHNASDMANNRWRYDRYFRRDGRHIGSCTWLVIWSEWCRDLWRPMDDLTYDQALENIFPIQQELNTVVTREHLIDDYTLSRNIARFGLHFTTVLEIMQKYGIQGNYFWHEYTITAQEKVVKMKEVLNNWGLNA